MTLDAEWAKAERRRIAEEAGFEWVEQPSPETPDGPAALRGRQLQPLAADAFLAMPLPPREMLLDPVLPRQGLALLYGPRGCGKTLLAMGIAVAIAGGGRFLRWRAPRAGRVLYIDGEMPASDLQRRLREALARAENPDLARANLAVLSADMADGLPDLATGEGRKALANVLHGFHVAVLDNLSALCWSGDENEASDWSGLQAWALAQRRAGRSLLLIHHAGKGGDQRGTSRREDVLDCTVRLSRPEGYSPAEGARFRVEFTKARGFFGSDAAPFEAWLRDGEWQVTEAVSATADRDARIAQLHAEGLSQREIARQIGCGLGTVNRALVGAN